MRRLLVLFLVVSGCAVSMDPQEEVDAGAPTTTPHTQAKSDGAAPKTDSGSFVQDAALDADEDDADTLDAGPPDSGIGVDGGACDPKNVKYQNELKDGGKIQQCKPGTCPLNECCYLQIACLPI